MSMDDKRRNRSSTHDQKRRKLSLDSLVQQSDELINVRDHFNLKFNSNGEISILNEYSRIRALIDDLYDKKLNDCSSTSSKVKLENSRLEIVQLLDGQKEALLNNINLLNAKVDLELNQIETLVDQAQVTDQLYNNQVREKILKLKDLIRNSILHHSEYVLFNLNVFPTSDADSVCRLEILPKKYHLADELINRVGLRPPKKVRLPQFESKCRLIPLSGHYCLVIESNPFRVLLLNGRSKLTGTLHDLGEQIDEEVIWLLVTHSDRSIFMLVLNEKCELFLQSYDYELNRLKSCRLERANPTYEKLKLKMVNNQLYVMRINDETSPGNARYSVQVYDEELTLHDEIFLNMNVESLGTPDILWATKNILYVSVQYAVDDLWSERQLAKRIYLVCRHSGTEIKKLDSELFDRLDCMCVTNEVDPKLVGVQRCSSLPGEHSIFVLNLNDASIIKQKQFLLNEQAKFDQVRMTCDGYLAFIDYESSICYFV